MLKQIHLLWSLTVTIPFYQIARMRNKCFSFYPKLLLAKFASPMNIMLAKFTLPNKFFIFKILNYHILHIKYKTL